jgi:hypothetical protein
MNFKTFLKFYFFFISFSFFRNQSCPNVADWQTYKSNYNIFFNSMADETTSYVYIKIINNSILTLCFYFRCNNYLATDGLIKNRNGASGQELLRHNKFSHWVFPLIKQIFVMK